MRMRIWLVMACSSVLMGGVLTAGPAVVPEGADQTAQFTVDHLLSVNNVSIADVSRDGLWIAVELSNQRDRLGIDSFRDSDPSYVAPADSQLLVVNTRSGERLAVFPEKRWVSSPRFSPDAARLAFLLRRGNDFFPAVWDRGERQVSELTFSGGKTADSSSDLFWTPEGTELVVAVRSPGWRDHVGKVFRALTNDPIVVRSSDNPFLAWEGLRRMSLQRSLVSLPVNGGSERELVAEGDWNQFHVTEDGRDLVVAADISEKTDYDTIFGAQSRLEAVSVQDGTRRVFLEKLDGRINGPSLRWSSQGRHYSYAKEGKLYFGAIDDEKPRILFGDEPKETEGDKAKDDSADKSAGAKEKKEKKETFSPLLLNQDGSLLIASSSKGIYLVNTQSKDRVRILEKKEGDEEAPNYQPLAFAPDQSAVYFSYASRTEWERGVERYDIASQSLHTVFRNRDLNRGLQFSEDGSTLAFLGAQGNHPFDLYVADGDFRGPHVLLEVNPDLDETTLARTELIHYLDVDGKKTNGVLYYPLGHKDGEKVPTVFNIYEQFFDDTFDATINVLTSNGYAVVRPSVNLEIGFPGEAWLKGVTAAANRVIEMGVADPDRLGVHGTSYGGYAVNLLVTQTNRFKAAINISGKVNMVSFYTDSPRLGVRNTHAPEKSQDRIGATLWEQPQKYLQHSAVLFADRIKTPLLLMTGEQDHNVPARQAMEMYYALRRLGKTVSWVSYTNGGHGMPRTNEEEIRDYHQRILDWYDKYLKKTPAVGSEETRSR